MNPHTLTNLVKAEAKRLGFEGCGISKAGFLEDEAPKLEQWLVENMHGQMKWMEHHFDKRLDPTKLVPGAKSVISVLLSYHQPELAEKHKENNSSPKISKYALGEDYHFVVKDKLFELYTFLEVTIGEINGRVFVDSAPVMDKVWAAKSGLGWMGKHSNILNKTEGSWFFLGEIIVDVEFDYDGPITDHCGSCTKCIDACPTDAIVQPYLVDGSKCISYFTIELRDEIPTEYHDKLGNWIFGCDICQDVCPWNRKAKPGKEERLFARNDFLDKGIEYWDELNLDEFRKLFRKNPVKRTKFEGLKRNVNALPKRNSKDT